MRYLLAVFTALFVAFCCCVDYSIAQKTLAPGVLKIIPADIDARDSHSLPLPIIGLESEKYEPNFAPVLDTLYGQTKNVVFFRDVWQYEFGFLGLRQVTLRLMGPDGKVRPEVVWYLVYRIRNTGNNISYVQQQDPETGHVNHVLQRDGKDFDIDSRFIPHFYLNGWVKPTDGQYEKVSYLDQIDRQAMDLIRQVEDRNRVLFDKVEMMNTKFPVVKSVNDDGVWGVAIWRNVDPRIDFVSVQIRGLTNAYRIHTTSNGEREFKYRTLQLNFWRPGDSIRQDEDDITYGIPLVDDPVRQIEICEKYSLPGPLIRGYMKSPTADQNVLVAEMDAQVQFSDFKSSITPPLDKGNLPEVIRAEFKKAGVAIAADAKVRVLVPEQKWTLAGKVDGGDRQLTIVVEPQYWESKGDGIRFINSLDNLWIYR